jgi:hypothetical protein
MHRTTDDRHRHSRIVATLDRARELARLRDRESSLETIVSEAPAQLARVRAAIGRLGGRS